MIGDRSVFLYDHISKLSQVSHKVIHYLIPLGNIPLQMCYAYQVIKIVVYLECNKRKNRETEGLLLALLINLVLVILTRNRYMIQQRPYKPGVLQSLYIYIYLYNYIYIFQQALHSECGTAQGPHMSCLYSDIAIQYFDIKAVEFNPPVICWKRFRDHIFVVWPHTLEELQFFLII